MEVILEINNLTEEIFPENFFKVVAEETLANEKLECLNEKKILISFALVDENEIAELNANYRKKDEPTDVLSFQEFDRKQLCTQAGEEVFLGEIVMCPEFLKKSAKVNETEFLWEAAYIFSHGILHLLGHEHGKEMFSLQELVANKISK